MSIITTDDMENASYRYTYDWIRQFIERKKTKCGREFLPLDANIGVAREVAHFGIRQD